MRMGELTPGCTAADARSIEREDKDLLVVDHGAEEFCGYTERQSRTLSTSSLTKEQLLCVLTIAKPPQKQQLLLRIILISRILCIVLSTCCFQEEKKQVSLAFKEIGDVLRWRRKYL